NRNRGIATKRTCPYGLIVFHPRRDDSVRRLPRLDPLHELAKHVERAGPRAAGAVTDSGCQEQPCEALCFFQAAGCIDDTLVVIDGAFRKDELIGQPMPQENFPAVSTEWAQIRIVRSDHPIELRPRLLKFQLEAGVVQRVPVKSGVTFDPVADM